MVDENKRRASESGSPADCILLNIEEGRWFIVFYACFFSTLHCSHFLSFRLLFFFYVTEHLLRKIGLTHVLVQ